MKSLKCVLVKNGWNTSQFFILFIKIDDNLLLISRNSELDEVEFSRFHSGVKRGDIVGICGHPG